MANSYTGIFPTLIAALDESQKALKAPNKLMECVYQDFKPTTAGLYDTITLNIPASAGTVSDVGAGSLSFQDVTATPKTVQLNKHPAYGFKLPDYDRMRSASPEDLRAMFVDEAIEKMATYINGQIAALITSGNFSQVIAGAAADTITIAEASRMWTLLAAAKVPVRDAANMHLLMHPTVYGSLFPDANWTGGNNISAQVAEQARLRAQLSSTFGAQPDFDLDMPVATGVYTSVMFHKRAFAMAARALESPQSGGVAAMQYVYKGVPIRITIDWNQTLLSYTITFDALFGVSVYRADHLVRHTST